MTYIRRKPVTTGTRRVTHLPSNPACRLDRQLPASRLYVTEQTRNESRAPSDSIPYYPLPDLSRLGSVGGWRSGVRQGHPPRRIRQNALLRKKPVGYRASAISLLSSRRKLWKRDFLGVRLATIPETPEESPSQEMRLGTTRPLPSIWEAVIERPRSSFSEIGQSPPPPTPTIRDSPAFQIPPCPPPRLSEDGTNSSSFDEDWDAYEFEFDLPSSKLDMTLPVAKFPMATRNEQVRHSLCGVPLTDHSCPHRIPIFP